MKHKLTLLSVALLLVGCSNSEVTSSSSYITPSTSEPGTSSVSSSLPTPSSSSSTSIEPSSNTTSSSSSTSSSSTSSTTPTLETLSLKQIQERGISLKEGEKGERIEFNATYVKAVTDNQDKLMLFVEEGAYLYVRVSGGFNDFLKNRYVNCDYHVIGTISKTNGNVEVLYESLNNLTSTPASFDYSSITTSYNSIEELLLAFKNEVNLNNKLTGVGKIVSFEARVVALDTSDANQKAFVYDGKNTMTIIDTKKICGTDEIGKKYRFTGSMSVLKSSPAILLLDMENVSDFSKDTPYDFSAAKEVKPSDFAKWYYVSDKINPPTYDDYGTLYKVTGYVADDESRTNAGKYYLGAMDEPNKSLADTGVKTSIKGVYFLNHLNLSERDLTYSVFGEYLYTETQITFYAVLHQFDTQNHGWKIVPLEFSVETVE